MRRSVQTMMAAALLLTVVQSAWGKDKFELVEERIRALAPSAQSIAVSETPMEGVLQVQVGGDIVYASDDGKYLLQGRLIDMDTREDLTEAAANLFAYLRALDTMLSGHGTMAVAPVPGHGLGRAINDRLARAAAPR